MEAQTLGWHDVDVFVGVDVGKGEHHAVATDRAGKRLFDKALPNDEARLRALIGQLKQRGRVLFVVDQPATIGALPLAVAHDEEVLVGYLPGLAMRRIADLHPGEAGRCRTHSDRSNWPTSRSLNCRCSAASMTTSPVRSPRPATGSAAC